MHDILKRYVNKFSVLNRFRLRVNGIMIEMDETDEITVWVLVDSSQS